MTMRQLCRTLLLAAAGLTSAAVVTTVNPQTASAHGWWRGEHRGMRGDRADWRYNRGGGPGYGYGYHRFDRDRRFDRRFDDGRGMRDDRDYRFRGYR